MPLFARSEKEPELPTDFGRMLTTYGEYLMGERRNFDQKLISDSRYRQYASRDPQGFVEAVAALVPAAAGTTALGACEVIYNIVGLRPTGDGWHHLMGQSVLYLQFRQVPWSRLKDYQRDFLLSEGVDAAAW